MDRDKWSSLVWLGMAIFICVGSLRLSLGTFHNPGPGFLSFLAGAILGILALVVHLRSWRTLSPTMPLWRDKDRGFKMVLTVFALLAYAVGMEYLGFLVSTIIFLAFLLRVIDPQRWSVVIFGSLLASGVSYAIFELWLKSQLPKGPWEIF